LLKAERSTPFNHLLKLARESKQTVVGNEFRTFTTLFAKSSDEQTTGASCFVKFIRMAPTVGRRIKGKKTVSINIH